MKFNKEKLIKRLKQTSTWRGIVLSLSQLSAFIDTHHWAIITGVALGVSGLIGALTDDVVGEDKSAFNEIVNTAANTIKDTLQNDKLNSK